MMYWKLKSKFFSDAISIFLKARPLGVCIIGNILNYFNIFTGGDGDGSSEDEEKKEKGGQFGHYAGIPGNGLPFEEDDDEDHTDFDDGFAGDDDDDNDDDFGDEDENCASYCSENTDVSMSQIAQPTQSDVSMRSAHASSNFQRNSFHPDAGNAAEKKEVCILLDVSFDESSFNLFDKLIQTVSFEVCSRVCAFWHTHTC